MSTVAKVIGTDLTRDVFQSIMSSVPSYYNQIYEAREILKADAVELALSKDSLNDLLEQLYIDTATWGLDYWERFLNIPRNPKLNHEERRSNVKAKRRSNATVTKERLESIALSYTAGRIEVVQVTKEYLINIKFTDIYGVPSNLSDCKRAIREIVPAHLNINYILKYPIWSEINSKNLTWNSINNKNLTWEQVNNGGLIS